MKSKAYIIRNWEEFDAVNNKVIEGFYQQDFFNTPPLIGKVRHPIIIYVNSRLGGDIPGWDFYANVGDEVLDKYDVVEASVLLRKQKLLKIQSS